jgi:hypothetical protein
MDGERDLRFVVREKACEQLLDLVWGCIVELPNNVHATRTAIYQ